MGFIYIHCFKTLGYFSSLSLSLFCHLCVCAQSVRLFATLCYSPPESSAMEFSRQEYWSGLPLPPPEDVPNPGIEPMSLISLAL